MNRNVVLLIPLCFLIAACTDSNDKIESDCGVVHNGELFNPVSEDTGTQVRITAIADNNLVVVRNEEDPGTILVKLHGISNKVDDATRAAAIEFLQSLGVDVPGRFFRAKDDCTDREPGVGDTIPGYVYNDDGLSYGEEVLKAGLGAIETGNKCDSDLIENCLSALLAQGQLPDDDADEE